MGGGEYFGGEVGDVEPNSGHLVHRLVSCLKLERDPSPVEMSCPLAFHHVPEMDLLPETKIRLNRPCLRYLTRGGAIFFLRFAIMFLSLVQFPCWGDALFAVIIRGS